MPFRYAIALGSNRRHGRHGAPRQILLAALEAMQAEGLALVLASRAIATPALGPAGRGFANAAAIIETRLDPPDLLMRLKRIERAFGRKGGRRWGPRVLDLDILLWSGGSWPPFPRQPAAHHLAIPHRALAQRHFVLAPLNEIAADWRDPRSGRTIRQLLRQLR